MTRKKEMMAGAARLFAEMTRLTYEPAYQSAIKRLYKKFNIDIREMKSEASKYIEDLESGLLKKNRTIELKKWREMDAVSKAISARMLMVFEKLVKDGYLGKEELWYLLARQDIGTANGVFTRELVRVMNKLNKKGLNIRIYHLLAGLFFDTQEFFQRFITLWDECTTGQEFIKKARTLSADIPQEDEDSLLKSYILMAGSRSRIIHYDEEIDKSLKHWKTTVLKSLSPEHTYLDITDLSKEEILSVLEGPPMNLSREHLRGKGQGGLFKHRIIYDGLSWEELREKIRSNPGDINKIENDYLRKYVNEHKGKSTECDNKHLATWRRRAINNFYKNVIVHPEMKDLKLQIRKRGRPRKQRNS